jgi:hypothetical protein
MKMSLTGSAAGVVSGIINSGRGIPSPDLTKLFQTIRAAGANQRNLINALPESLKPLYDQYVKSTSQASQDLQTGTDEITDRLKKETEANYGPEATRAALDAIKGEIYAELPGQQNAIRQALAATGGFDRGTASKQLAAPVLQAAQKYATAAASLTADQLKTKQAAVQQALNTIASLDSQTLQAKFGMSKEQATQILSGNRQDLKDQLADLINQSNTETNQMLGVQSDQAMNDYRKAVARNAQQDALTNAIVGLGADAISAANPGLLAAINSPTAAPANYSPNMAPNQAAVLGY